MAPYLGLMTVLGTELAGGGYVRKDLSDVAFRVSPRERGDHDLTVLNWDSIVWLNLRESVVIGLAVFEEADGDKMITASEIGPLHVRDRDQLVIAAGSLRFGHHFTKDKAGRNIDTTADTATTDRWREALTRIAEAPRNVRSRELRAIARVALLME